MNRQSSLRRGHCVASLHRGPRALTLSTILLAISGGACEATPEPESEVPSWEEFERDARLDPDVPGAYRIDDVKTASLERLRAAYDALIQPRAWVEGNYAFTGDGMTIMDPESRMTMTYCVANSGTFGWSDPVEHAAVVGHMHDAAVRWERAADVNFIYDSTKDGRATAPHGAASHFGVSERAAHPSARATDTSSPDFNIFAL